MEIESIWLSFHPPGHEYHYLVSEVEFWMWAGLEVLQNCQDRYGESYKYASLTTLARQLARS